MTKITITKMMIDDNELLEDRYHDGKDLYQTDHADKDHADKHHADKSHADKNHADNHHADKDPWDGDHSVEDCDD